MNRLNPQQLVDTKIPPNYENAEAYLYEFKNLLNDKIYIGVRKGVPLVDYYFSSEDKELLTDFGDSKSQFTFKVLEYGTFQTVLAKETKILKSVDAKNNPNYYNKSNGYADDSILPDPKTMMAIAKEILEHKRINYNGIVVERVKVKKEVLKKIKKFQTRRQILFHSHKQKLQQIIMDKGGSTEHLTIVVLQNRNGEDVAIGGNHSEAAIQGCKKALYAYVLYIPQEIHKNWNELDVKQLSGFLNPRQENPTLESNDDDIEDMVVDLLEKGFTVDSVEVTDIYNYYFLNTSQRSNISKKAKKRIKEQELSNINWINYKADPDCADLEKKVTAENAKQGVYCKAYSTGKLDYWRDIIKIRKRNKVLIQTKQFDKLIRIFKIILWHPSQQAETDHFQLYAADDKDTLDWVFNRNNNDTKDTNDSIIKIIVEYLPTTRIKEVI